MCLKPLQLTYKSNRGDGYISTLLISLMLRVGFIDMARKQPRKAAGEYSIMEITLFIISCAIETCHDKRYLVLDI